VIAARAPGIDVIDITHQVPAHDIRAGALTLWRSAPWLAPGVILAVVDPGVGGSRRSVAIEVAAAEAVLVGPDNGLLGPAAARLGSITAAIELAGPPPGASAPGGATFAGRDVFAPASADLARGVALNTLGTPIDPAGLVAAALPNVRTGPDGSLGAEVLWVDRFGNAQLNVTPLDTDHLGAVVELRAAGRTWPARRVNAYAELGPGEVGLVTDSYALLAVSCREESAASRVGLAPGDEVWLMARA
jgi:S-adenosyl-L-methionine hydrolase (adenosine-forming)